MKSQHAYRYKPFPKLEHSKVPGHYPGRPRVTELGRLVYSRDFFTMREKAVRLIDDLLLGLRYLETFVRVNLDHAEEYLIVISDTIELSYSR